MEILKLLSANEIVAQVISFVILLVLLRAFAWKKILSFLDARKDNIALGLKDIEDAKAEVSRLKGDYEARLAAIEESAQKRIQEAVAQGKIISEEARKEAYLSAQEIINNARESVKYELAKAKVELRDEIVDLTIKATENLIREKLTDQQDRQLVKDFIDEIDKIE